MYQIDNNSNIHSIVCVPSLLHLMLNAKDIDAVFEQLKQFDDLRNCLEEGDQRRYKSSKAHNNHISLTTCDLESYKSRSQCGKWEMRK